MKNTGHLQSRWKNKIQKKNIVKSKTINPSGIELMMELRTKNATTDFVNRIAELASVENATLVSYNGEYIS